MNTESSTWAGHLTNMYSTRQLTSQPPLAKSGPWTGRYLHTRLIRPNTVRNVVRLDRLVEVKFGLMVP